MNDDFLYLFLTILILYNLFPHKVGTRVLKSLSVNTGDGQHCLGKYNNYFKKDPNVGLKMFTGFMLL